MTTTPPAIPAAKPLPNRDPLLREKIRQVLMMTTYKQSDEMICDAVNALIAGPMSAVEYLRVREWNQTKGYIDYERNPDQDRDEWFLTKRGQEKQNTAS